MASIKKGPNGIFKPFLIWLFLNTDIINIYTVPRKLDKNYTRAAYIGSLRNKNIKPIDNIQSPDPTHWPFEMVFNMKYVPGNIIIDKTKFIKMDTSKPT